MAQQEDLEIDKGSDVAIRLDLYNTDGSAKIMNTIDSGGNQIEIYTINGKIKKTYSTKDSDAIVFSATSIDPDDRNNVVHLSLTNIQTEAMKAGRYVYDVDLIFADSDSDQGSFNQIERILQGNLTVTPGT